MARILCEQCGGTYAPVQRDGSRYFHVCPAEVITYAVFDDTGKELAPEVRTVRLVSRDENIDPTTRTAKKP